MKVLIFDIVARKLAGWTYSWDLNRAHIKFRKWFTDKQKVLALEAIERRKHNDRVLYNYGLHPNQRRR